MFKLPSSAGNPSDNRNKDFTQDLTKKHTVENKKCRGFLPHTKKRLNGPHIFTFKGCKGN